MSGYPARGTTVAPPVGSARSAPVSRLSRPSWRDLAPAAALVLLCCAGARAGEPGDAAGRSHSAPGQPPYHAAADVHQMMAWIVDPAADVIWDAAGTIITAEGSEELAPTTDKGWAKVQRAAAILTESGNLLMMPGRAAGEDWIAWSRQLVDTGKSAMQAAAARDADALFDAGGRIYQVCKGCHDQYWITFD
jgi:hypothetical protein